MAIISKAELKKQLHAMGVTTYKCKRTKAIYIKKSDGERVLANSDEPQDAEWETLEALTKYYEEVKKISEAAEKIDKILKNSKSEQTYKLIADTMEEYAGMRPKNWVSYMSNWETQMKKHLASIISKRK